MKQLFPKKKIWGVFYLSNEDAPYNNYLWWFPTRKLAREYIQQQKKLNCNHKQSFELSPPMLFFKKENFRLKMLSKGFDISKFLL